MTNKINVSENNSNAADKKYRKTADVIQSNADQGPASEAASRLPGGALTRRRLPGEDGRAPDAQESIASEGPTAAAGPETETAPSPYTEALEAPLTDLGASWSPTSGLSSSDLAGAMDSGSQPGIQLAQAPAAAVVSDAAAAAGAASTSTAVAATAVGQGAGLLVAAGAAAAVAMAISAQQDKDTTPPTLVITSDKAALKAGETAVITFTFSEDPGNTFGADDVVLTGGTLGTISGTGLVRTAVFTPAAGLNAGSASITAATSTYTDAAGNGGGAGTTPSISIDTLPPTLAITSDKAALKISETAVITFTFSEDPLAGFTASDLVVSGGTLGAISGTGLTRTATFTPAAGLNAGSASITAATSTYTDAAGNSGGAGTTPSISIDTLAPTLAITSDKAALNQGETAVITFTFSEDPGNTFGADDVVLTGGTLGTISGTGLVRTAVFTPAAGLNAGSASITAATSTYTDAAGNGGGAGTTPSISIDTLPPTLAITSDKAALKISETAVITFTFSEDPLAGFTASDLVVSGGTLGAISGTGLTRTATFTPAADQTGVNASITVAAGRYTDAAANNGLAAIGPSISLETRTPIDIILQDGYLDGADLWVDMDDNGSITDGDFWVGPSVNGLVQGYLTAAQKGHALIAAGGTDISTGLPFQGSYSASPGSTVVNPLTTLVQSIVQNSVALGGLGGLSGEERQAALQEAKEAAMVKVSQALGLPAGTDLTQIDTIATATAGTDDAASGLTLEQALEINSKALMVANMMAVGAAALKGASTGTGSEAASMDDLAGYVVAGIVQAINTAASTGQALALGDADSLSSILTNAGEAAKAGNVTMDETKLSEATESVSTAVASTNSLIDTLTGNAKALADTNPEAATGTLIQILAAQKAAMNQIEDIKSGDSNTFSDLSTNFADPAAALNQSLSAGSVRLGTAEGITAPTTIAQDSQAPKVLSISVSSERVGDLAHFVVKMSEGVSVRANAQERPTLLISNADSSTALAVFDPGQSGGDKLVFTYRVQAGDTQLGLPSNAQITLPDGASIRDLGGNNATLSLVEAIAAFSPESVDTQAPAIQISAAQSFVRAGESTLLTFAISEKVSALAAGAFSAGDITVKEGGLEVKGRISEFKLLTGEGGAPVLDDGQYIYTARLAPGSDTAPTEVGVNSGRFTDEAGNPNTASNMVAVGREVTQPAVSILAEKSFFKLGDSTAETRLHFKLSQASANFTEEDVTITGGGVLSGFTRSGSDYSATLSQITSSTQVVVGAGRFTADAGQAGNLVSNTLSFKVDASAPAVNITVTSMTGGTITTLNPGETAKVVFTLSEEAAGFGPQAVRVSGGSLSDFKQDAQIKTQWSAVFNPAAVDAKASVVPVASIQVDAARFSDLVGNPNTATSVVKIDALAPTVTLSSNASALRIGQSATITFDFSEDPRGTFSAADVQVAGGSLGPISGTGLTRSAVFTPTANTSGQASIAVAAGGFSDWAGNLNARAVSPSMAVSTLAPTVSAVTDATQAAITKDAISFTVTFSEALTGTVGTGNFTATNGTVTSVTPIQSSNAYTVVVTPTPGLASGDVKISLVGTGLSDAAGNALADADLSGSQAVDTLAPMANFSAVKNSLGQPLRAGPTNSTSLELSGSNEVGASVSVYNGSELLGQATVTGTGWTYSVLTAHSGTYDLQVQETDTAGNVGPMKAYFSGAGDAVIDLGAGNGQLIAPVQVDGGKWFYHWDRNKNQDSSDDLIPRYELNSIFKYSSEGIEGTGTTDTYRYASLNGVLLALPTLGVSNEVLADWFATKSQQEKVDPEWTHMVPPATAIGSLDPGVGDVTLNPTYNGLLSIWDAFNGKAETALAGDGDSKGSINGAPQGWGTGWAEYASASKDLTSLDRHYTLPLAGGWLESQSDGEDKEGYRNSFYVALEVFKPIIVIDTLAPSVSTVTEATTATITKDEINFTVTFSKALAGTVGTGNFTATNGTVTTVTRVDASNAYSVVVTPAADVASGNVTLSLVGAGLSDAVGNAVVDADLSGLATQAIDTLAPVAVFSAIKDANGDLLTAGPTTSTSLLLSGSNELGSTVKVYNGSTLLGQAEVTDTNWTYSVSAKNGEAYHLKITETDLAGHVSAPKAYLPGAGDAVIDLGVVNGVDYGQLIAPVQVDGGKWFYYWDRNGNDVADNEDVMSRFEINQIFNEDSNGEQGTGTTDTVRFATLNGMHLALPTLGLSNPNTDLLALTQAGTAVGSATKGVGDNTVNTAYDDLLAIWDAYNGDQVSLQGVEYWQDPIGGLPLNWLDYGTGVYASATPSFVWGPDDLTRHYTFMLGAGAPSEMYDGTASEPNIAPVALQAFEPSIVIDTRGAPVMTGAATASVQEGAAGTVYTASATQAGSTLTYALGGADAALFNINESTGAVTFLNAPDFETPGDVGDNNVYNIDVTASNGVYSSLPKAVAITVGNVYEAPVMVTGASWATTFNEGALSSKLNMDVPEPSQASVVLDTVNQQLDFSARGSHFLYEYYYRDGAPIVWADLPEVQLGQSWSVQTRVSINDGLAEPQQSAGIAFYDADGGVPNFYFSLTKWIQATYSLSDVAGVATQSGSGNGISGEAYTLLAPETSDVYLKVQVTELGLTDHYQFFYKGLLAQDPWIAVGDAKTYTSKGNDSRVGLFYKTNQVTAGVAFDDFAITVPVSVAENSTGTVYTANAIADNASTLTYALGGTDSALFSIHANSGEVAFKAAPNFEAPLDNDGDNQYDLTVTASDGVASSVPQSVVISVTNVAESSAVNVTAAPAQVAEGDAGKLVYTFTRSNDLDRELTVNIGVTGTADPEDYSRPLQSQWTRLMGASRSPQAPTSAAAGADGAVYVSGRAESSLLDGTNVLSESGGGYVRKFDADGSLVWTRLTDAVNDNYPNSVTTGADGGVYVAGMAYNPAQVNYDGFVNKFDAAGELEWTSFIGTLDYDSIESMSTDANGIVYVAGLTYSSQTGYSTFISKLESDGVLAWSRPVALDYSPAISVSPIADGPVYVTGYSNSAILDGENKLGEYGSYVSKYDADGTLEWTRLPDASGSSQTNSVAAGADGAVYVAGYAYNAVSQNNDGFVAKFDAAGTLVWTSFVGGSGHDDIKSVFTGEDGAVYVAGETNSSLNGQVIQGAPNTTNGFVGKLDADDGTLAWTHLIGGSSNDLIKSVSVDADGVVYIAGETYSSSLDGQNNQGNVAGFVSKILPASLTQVTFAPGSATATLTLKATADTETDDAETVTVTVLAGQGYSIGSSSSATGTIEENLAPIITSANTVSVAENTSGSVYTVIATDANAGSTLAYALDGTDAALFNINASTGVVSFKTAPNFEAPLDTGTNNVYNITVTASDGVNTSAAQAVAITVTNVDATVNVAVTAGLITTPLNFGLSTNGLIDGAQSVYLIPVDGFASAIGQDVLTWSFASGNFGGDRSITPLLFEKVGEDYVLRAIGSTQQAQGNTVYQDLAFNVLVGDASIKNADYIFGWKDGTQTQGNEGVIANVSGSPGLWISRQQGQAITEQNINLPVDFSVRYDTSYGGRDYQFSVNTGIIKDLPVVTEGDAAQLFYTFTRSGDIDGALTVNFEKGGTATADDYAPSLSEITFAAGSSTATLALSARADQLTDINETLTVTVTQGQGYSLGLSASATGTIQNKLPTVSTITESTSAAVTKDAITFTVTFSEALTGTVGTSNFTASSGSVTSVARVDTSNVYTVVVTPTAGMASGTVALSLVGAGLADAAGNQVADADLNGLATQAIDTLSPMATFTAVKNALGGLLSPGLTNSASLELSGSNEAGASVSVYNGSTLLGQAVVTGTNWTYSLTTTNGITYDLQAQETDAAGNVGPLKAYFAGAGDAVIDLGEGNGQLIAPVQVDGGKWFYHWDVSGDGTAFDKDANEYSADHVLGWKLHDIFNKDVNGVQGPGTSETYRYATLNGVHLALPTIGLKDDVVATFTNYGNVNGPMYVATLVGASYAETGGVSGIAYTEQAGSAIGSLKPSEGDNTINPLYDDLLAIWDAYNGNSTTESWRYNQFGTGWGDKPNISGMPTGWSSQGSPSYASASHNYVLGWNAFERHYELDLSSGTISGNGEGARDSDSNKFMVALQVLGRPVIVVDTLAPVPPTIALGLGVDGGATSTEAEQITGVVTITAETGASTVVTFTNGQEIVIKTVTGNGATAVPVVLTAEQVTDLGEGEVSVRAVATDAAGNASDAGVSTFTRSTAQPPVTIAFSNTVTMDGAMKGSDSNIANLQTTAIKYTLTTSVPIQGLDIDDFLVSNGEVISVYQPASFEFSEGQKLEEVLGNGLMIVWEPDETRMYVRKLVTPSGQASQAYDEIEAVGELADGTVVLILKTYGQMDRSTVAELKFYDSTGEEIPGYQTDQYPNIDFANLDNAEIINSSVIVFKFSESNDLLVDLQGNSLPLPESSSYECWTLPDGGTLIYHSSFSEARFASDELQTTAEAPGMGVVFLDANGELTTDHPYGDHDFEGAVIQNVIRGAIIYSTHDTVSDSYSIHLINQYGTIISNATPEWNYNYDDYDLHGNNNLIQINGYWNGSDESRPDNDTYSSILFVSANGSLVEAGTDSEAYYGGHHFEGANIETIYDNGVITYYLHDELEDVYSGYIIPKNGEPIIIENFDSLWDGDIKEYSDGSIVFDLSDGTAILANSDGEITKLSELNVNESYSLLNAEGEKLEILGITEFSELTHKFSSNGFHYWEISIGDNSAIKTYAVTDGLGALKGSNTPAEDETLFNHNNGYTPLLLNGGFFIEGASSQVAPDGAVSEELLVDWISLDFIGAAGQELSGWDSTLYSYPSPIPKFDTDYYDGNYSAPLTLPNGSAVIRYTEWVTNEAGERLVYGYDEEWNEIPVSIFNNDLDPDSNYYPVTAYRVGTLNATGTIFTPGLEIGDFEFQQGQYIHLWLENGNFIVGDYALYDPELNPEDIFLNSDGERVNTFVLIDSTGKVLSEYFANDNITTAENNYYDISGIPAGGMVLSLHINELDEKIGRQIIVIDDEGKVGLDVLIPSGPYPFLTAVSPHGLIYYTYGDADDRVYTLADSEGDTVIETFDDYLISADGQLFLTVNDEVLTWDWETKTATPLTFTPDLLTWIVEVKPDDGVEGEIELSLSPDATIANDDDTPLSLGTVTAAPVVLVDTIAPVFEGGASADTTSVEEGSIGTVYTAIATDSGSTLTYGLAGDDADWFDIDEVSGAVTFKDPPNYETQDDADGDNVYNITVTASDGANMAEKDVEITVEDVVSVVALTVGAAALEGGNLVYTFTRSGDIGDALSVDIGYGGTASPSDDYAIDGPFGKSWSQLVGGAVSDNLSSIATTAGGGFYAVGQASYYTANNPLISADGKELEPLGDSDGYIRKFDSDGTEEWTRLYGGSTADNVTSVTVDADGSAYVTGNYYDGGLTKKYITKFTSAGVQDWTFGSDVLPQGTSQASLALAPDDGSTLFIGGSYYGGSGDSTFLTKITLEESGPPATPSTVYLTQRATQAIAAAGNGVVYLTGYTNHAIEGQNYAEGGDAFLSKLNSDGTVAWSRLIGGSSWDSGTSVVVGSDGGVYVAGFIDSSYFVKKFEANGASAWSATIANGSNYASSLAIGSDGFVYLSGITTQAIDGQAVLGGNDAFVTRIDPESGQRTFTRILGSDGDDRATAIAAGPNGEILIGGTAYKSYNIVYDGLQSLGSLDGFVTQFAPPTLPTTVTFAPGSATATLTLKTKADDLTEGNETVTLMVVTGNGYIVGTATSATGTIENVDTTAPTVATFGPTDAATGVAVGSNIVLTFSEAIQRGTGNIQIRSGSATGEVVETFDAATSTGLSISNSTLTINPTSDLAYGTRYFVTFAAGSVRDLAGNNYAGTITYDFTSVAAADGSFQFEANTRTHGFAYEIPSSELDLSSVGTQLYGSFASVDGGTAGASSIAAVQVLTLPEGLGIVNQLWNLYPAIVFSPGETVTLAVAGEALTHTFVADALTLEDLVAGWQVDSDFDAADITLSVIDSTITIMHNSVGPQAAAAVELAGVASLDGSVAPSVDQLVSIIRAAPSYPDAPFYVYADPNNSVYGGANAANKSIVLQWKQPSGGSPGFKFGEQYWPAAGPLANYPVFEHQLIDLSATVNGSGFSAGTTLTLAIDDPGTDGQLDLTHTFTTGALTLSGLVSGWRADPDFDAAGIYLSVSGSTVKIEYERYSDPSLATVSLPGTNLSEAITVAIPYDGTGTKWSTLSTYPYLVSSITGRFEGISAEGGIEIEPGRFEDQIIYNIPQWNAALYSATVKLDLPTLTEEVWTITEFDGAVTDVDADGDLDVSDLKAALEAAEGFNTAGVALSVIDDDLVVTYEYYANVPDVAALDLTTVANSIDLGALGQLIAPVQVEGKWYYHLDRNEDGTIAGDAYTLSDANTYPLSEIYDLFKQDVNGGAGSATDETYRYAVINGVKLALPELGAVISNNLDGTSANNPQATNSAYDGLAAIWDAHNGSQQGSYLGQGLNGSTTSSNGYDSGVPPGWLNDTYVSATPQDGEYAFLRIYDGLVGPHANWGMNVALQVL
jgi:hypothetical protein